MGAHYDYWYRGFIDNVLGVAQAVEAFRRLGEAGVAARLLLFGAEESGALGFAGWYWAWGSRWYARLEAARGRLGEVAAYANFDTAGTGCLRASGAPQLLETIGGLELPVRRWECPECDSFSLASMGVPTLSLHSLWCSEYERVYHTPDDTPDRASRRHAELAVEAAVRALTARPEPGAFRAMLHEVLGRGPLRARKVLHLLEHAGSRAGWEDLYRAAARRFLKPMHYGSYRWDTADLEAVWFPEVEAYRRLLGDLRRGRAPSEVIVAGEERLLYQLSPGPGSWGSTGLSQLGRQLDHNMDRLELEAEELVRDLIR